MGFNLGYTLKLLKKLLEVVMPTHPRTMKSESLEVRNTSVIFKTPK